jgi:hypothetical protein
MHLTGLTLALSIINDRLRAGPQLAPIWEEVKEMMSCLPPPRVDEFHEASAQGPMQRPPSSVAQINSHTWQCGAGQCNHGATKTGRQTGTEQKAREGGREGGREVAHRR